MEKLCVEHDLLFNRGGIVRVPFLIKGTLRVPPEIESEQIETAFSRVDEKTVCVKLPGAQIVREPVIDRKTMKYTGDYVYQIMPLITSDELIALNISRPFFLLCLSIITWQLACTKSAA
jgi:hypothetical protein